MAAGLLLPLVWAAWCSVSALAATRSESRSHLRVQQASQAMVPDFLFMSSPIEKKVSYALIHEFQAKDGVIQPLLDVGLGAPHGIAYHKATKGLFVADPEDRKILRYTIQATACTAADCKLPITLSVTGFRHTIAENINCNWVIADEAGNVYFTDKDTNSINKITHQVVHKIVSDKLKAANLTMRSTQQAIALATTSGGTNTSDPLEPIIQTLYDSYNSNRISSPSGLAIAGRWIYWTNAGGGLQAGSVVGGPLEPFSSESTLGGAQAAQLLTHAASNSADLAFGIATTNKAAVFSSRGLVYGTHLHQAGTVELSKQLIAPEGLVWDGDNTVYVADSEGNTVSSLPSGSLENDILVTKFVDFHGPFGLALAKGSDALFAGVRASMESEDSSVYSAIWSLWNG